MEHSDDEEVWKLRVSYTNTTGRSHSSLASYVLGKHNWLIERDKGCDKGTPYSRQLKLTSCGEGEFTCDNGLCVKMEERCDQVPHCKDESDEKGCQLLNLKKGYNKRIPPIVDSNDPVYVDIRITLLKVVRIVEEEHSIELQFKIQLEWRDNRVTYHNLKNKTSLNALTDKDIAVLWLPLVIYTNTDQKQTTRLGEYGNGEWSTSVTVRREGRFTRTGLEDVDETEVFKGEENSLIMQQTYTHKFQCVYQLKKYPFDTQVRKHVEAANLSPRCVTLK